MWVPAGIGSPGNLLISGVMVGKTDPLDAASLERQGRPRARPAACPFLNRAVEGANPLSHAGETMAVRLARRLASAHRTTYGNPPGYDLVLRQLNRNPPPGRKPPPLREGGIKEHVSGADGPTQRLQGVPSASVW